MGQREVSVTFKNDRFIISDVLIDKYREAYPSVNVAVELKKMEAWVLSQPKSR